MVEITDENLTLEKNIPLLVSEVKFHTYKINPLTRKGLVKSALNLLLSQIKINLYPILNTARKVYLQWHP